MQERSRLRSKMIEAEERAKQLEREQEFRQGMAKARLQTAETGVLEFRLTLRNLVAKNGPDHPEVKSGQNTIQYMEKEAAEARHEYERWEREFTERRIDARKGTVELEDRLLLLDRMTATQRQHLQTHRDALVAQALRQHGLSGRADAGTDRLAEIDRKLDDLKRELADLRRELRK